MFITITQYDEAAIRGCYLNGCSIDEIFSVFDGMYTKDEIRNAVDKLIKQSGWKGKGCISRTKILPPIFKRTE